MRVMRIAGENDFSNDVGVSVYGLDKAKPGMLPDEVTLKATVNFSIEVDYRNWGIKGILLTPHGTVSVVMPMTSEDEARREDVTITFEPGKLRRDERPSDSVTVGEVDLWVNPDLTPDYRHSTVVVYGPTRGD